MSDRGDYRSDGSYHAAETSGPSRRRFLGALVALGAAGGAAAVGWLRQRNLALSESVAGRTATVSSLQSSVVEVDPGPADSTDSSGGATQSDAQATVDPPATETPTTESTVDQSATQPDATLTVDVPVICRQSWGATAARDGLQPHTIERLTVHHTASPISRVADGPGNIRSHQRFHQQDKGWPDIAYHFLVDPVGNIYQGRDPAFGGDTATNYDPNGHFLVCLEGDYDRAGVNDSQVASLALVLAWGVSTFGVDAGTLGGHRDYADTQCPGDSVYQLLTDGSLTGRIEAVLAQGEPAIVEVCGAEGDRIVSEVEASDQEI